MGNVTGEILGTWVTNFSYILGAVMTVSLLGLYLLFAVMVVRQTLLLNSLLETQASLVLKPLAYLHFIFALLIFILSLVYLRQYLPIP
ncbi:MAG: DUF5657 family protein [Patescibacteria group bacterium]